MSTLKRVARIAAGAILATGIFAGSVAPASAVSPQVRGPQMHTTDTGWGG
ncbi:MAG TPA: hypothetical protein VFE07_09600 [Marmoricola sp.]|nr:hypothetical protein [Marmoricola sp.]